MSNLDEYLKNYGSRLTQQMQAAGLSTTPAAGVGAQTFPLAQENLAPPNPLPPVNAGAPAGGAPASPIASSVPPPALGAGAPAPSSNLEALAPPSASPTVGLGAPGEPSGAIERAGAQAGLAPPKSKGGTTFAQVFGQLPEKVQEAEISKLEQALAAQRQSIDSAYDKMVQDLGERPEQNLSRREKALLVMQFGLALMKASGAGAHGGDLGGAIGDAGLQTLGAYQGLKGQKKAEGLAYDERKRGLEQDRYDQQKDLLGIQRQAEADSNLASYRDRTATAREEEVKGNLETNRIRAEADRDRARAYAKNGGRGTSSRDRIGEKRDEWNFHYDNAIKEGKSPAEATKYANRAMTKIDTDRSVTADARLKARQAAEEATPMFDPEDDRPYEERVAEREQTYLDRLESGEDPLADEEGSNLPSPERVTPPASNVPPGAPTATGPNGSKVYWDGKAWVPVK